MELSSKNGVGWFRKLRMAEWLIPKVATGKKVGGWLEGGWKLEQGASLGLFCPNTVEAKDRSGGRLSALPQLCISGIIPILLFLLLLFLKVYLFIYFWLCWVFVSVRGLSLIAASGGHSSSRCEGLSLSWPLLLRGTGSRRAGSVVVAHGTRCSAACGIFPDQGSNPCPLHWQGDSQPLRHQGSPIPILLVSNLFHIFASISLRMFAPIFIHDIDLYSFFPYAIFVWFWYQDIISLIKRVGKNSSF